MAIDTIGFSCAQCGTSLLVPASMAGVEGPCPNCGQTIRAPRLGLIEVAKVVEPAAVRLEVERPADAPKQTPMPALVPLAETTMVESSLQRSAQRSRLLGMTLLAVLGLALVIGAIAILQSWRAEEKLKQEKIAQAALSPETKQEPSKGIPPSEPAPAEAATVDAKQDLRVPPEGMNVQALVQEAGLILTQFLQAKSLEERLPMIETETPQAELKDSVLSLKLPLGGKFQMTETIFNKLEGFTDVLFEVPFNAGADKKMEILMVRTRGSQLPKVVVDAFLDGYGGRLRNFISSPEEGEHQFRTLMSVFDFCSSSVIPSAENKKTVKILATRGGGDIAKAYFGKFSPLGKKLERLGMKYGRTTAVTLTLRWNRQEDPARPFLELIDVKSLNWD
jgi:hypothetical protein